ncbi:MAG: nrfC [Chitinophagaceae bacterium]|nr:nrfC [Chitinophagaceae bacterium]
MKEKNKVFWKGVEELQNEPEFIKNNLNEFPASALAKDGSDDSAPDRRDFLKLVGFSVAAATLAACEAPVKKAIPYLNKPEEIEPGIANWYASTYTEGGDYCSVLVKTREGRPIKVEGNKLSSVSRGGASARVQSSVLSLYDTERLKGVQVAGKASSWEAADAAIIDRLAKVSQEGGAIRLVSSTVLSPTTLKAIAEFKAKYPTTEHVVYDAISANAISKANGISFGKAVIPSYDFSKAEIIVSFAADFLATWSAGDYSIDFANTRKLSKNKKTMSRLYAFESNLSLTGSNADYRAPIKLSQEGLFVAELYNRLTSARINTEAVKNDILDRAVNDLLQHKGKSIVVSGSNDVNVQLLINEINLALGNYGKTINLSSPVNYRLGDDEKMNQFVDDLNGDKIAAVIFYGANPVYDHPRAEEIKAGLKKTKLSVSFADRADETASAVEFITPDHHYLESWNDAEPKPGFYSLCQPTISPLFKTRQAQESLLKWAGNNADYYTYLKNNWTATVLNGASWDKALHDGVHEAASVSTEVAPVSSNFNASAVEAGIAKVYSSGKGIDLKLYEKVAIGSGAQANNPWLQELPDPISKATWDNYLAVSKKYADENNWKEGTLVDVKVGNKKLAKAVPVLIQPGQAAGTASLALGYGREKAGKVGTGVGANAFALASIQEGLVQYSAFNVTITATGGFSQIAQTQTHHTIMNRPIVQDATLADYIKDPSAGRFFPTVTTADGKVAPAKVDIWKDQHIQPNHKWGMNIDLNSCLGCGACVISCQAENNVPVVGKREVINRREMHWIRIDRYYSSDAESKKTGVYFEGDTEAMEHPSENPQVTFQPMMCQHCDHAPCESVCPVAATTHSTEGLNQMTYNRCVGTRYCANNCPYKVRRFNWFKYFDNGEVFDKNTSMNTALGRMVLNPDVTVRSRGVMEKCSMCVQRIQEGKLIAKKEKRHVKDGEINIACAAACPTEAITFGDQNDLTSRISVERNELNKERAYAVLEELNVQPNVLYLTKIRNTQA